MKRKEHHSKQLKRIRNTKARKRKAELQHFLALKKQALKKQAFKAYCELNNHEYVDGAEDAYRVDAEGDQVRFTLIEKEQNE